MYMIVDVKLYTDKNKGKLDEQQQKVSEMKKKGGGGRGRSRKK